MANASYAVPHFLGGEISAFAQGRFDKPDYRVSMRSCLNAFPVEIGAWTRRGGTQFAGLTRLGARGRVIPFDFQQANAVSLEFTDFVLRFRTGARLLFTNDAQLTVGISAANPAVVQLAAPSPWVSTNAVEFFNPNDAPVLLQNRHFFVTKIDTTHYSLFDGLTGLGIDGSAIGTAIASVARIQELATPYSNGTWAHIRSVQAETTDILLCPEVAPQALTVTTQPAPNTDTQFAIKTAVFNDGPYLDPFTNGVQATPSAKSGVINLTLSFPAFDAAKAYAAGAFVTSVGINYVSLLDQNVGNTPASLAPWWATTSASAAINGGRGFLGTDTGRLVRLLSEPAAWVTGTSYTPASVVSYNPSGQPGAALYYQSLVTSSATVAPGLDLTTWKLIPQGAAIWSWGKITGLSNIVDRALAGSVAIGDMTSVAGGGVAAAFNGAFSQSSSASALAIDAAAGFIPTNSPLIFTHYVGKNYAGASDQQIQQATVYPSSNLGFGAGTAAVGGVVYGMFNLGLTFNLRGKASAPASSADGTLLASVATANFSSAVTLISNDQTTAWKYVWIEEIVTASIPGAGGAPSAQSYSYDSVIAQISFFAPTGVGSSGGASVEILGPPLLYTTPITTWRLGVYSDGTGWPTCGLYNDGRLYLGGAVGNRFDACVSNGIVGSTVNFAPTDQYGAVAPSSAFSYVFNSKGVNQILWMDGDLQGILMGTQAGEWLVVAPTAGSIAPNNISARNVTKHGSANIQPCETEHTRIFVQRFGQKLLEYFPDVYSGKFSAPNLADKAQHLTRARVAELAYTSAVTPILWGRDTMGALFGITYKRDSLASAQPPTFYGWHRHALGSGRTVESICAVPSADGTRDSLTMVSTDPLTNIRHVEILTEAPDEQVPLAQAWHLDDAVTPSSTVLVSTPSVPAPQGGLILNGLWHLNGKTVQVFAGGLDCGDPGEGKPFADFLVTNGSVFVPFGDGITAGPGRGLFTAAFFATNPPFVVGFTYESNGQLVRMIAQADTGARNGPAFVSLSRGHRFGAKLVNTLGISFGGDLTKKMYPALFETDGRRDWPALTSYSGIYQAELRDDYGYDNALCWRVTRPWPATVVAIGSNLATSDQ